MDYGLPGSSIHGIFQARVLEWGASVFSIQLLVTSYSLQPHFPGKSNGLGCHCLLREPLLSQVSARHWMWMEGHAIYTLHLH